MTTLSLHITHIQRVAELLLGAAHADDDYDGHEAEMIGDILRELVPTHSLPSELTSHLARFDVDDLDIASSCLPLVDLPEDARHAILGLIVRVVEADGVLDLAENDYIHHVAQHLQIDESSYGDYVIDLIEIDEVSPPPIPIQHR